MGFADEQSYEEMIAALNRYISEVEAQCDIMCKAGEDCVDNTEDDPAAIASKEKIEGHVKKIKAELETVGKVIRALQDEIERIRAEAKKAAQD